MLKVAQLHDIYTPDTATDMYLDARAMKGYGMGDNKPVFLSEVECSGSEQMLEMCSSLKLVDDSCNQGDIVGVTCGSSTSEA